MTLYQPNEDQQDWTIIQISDTHLMDQDDLEFVEMNPEQSFHAVMQQIQQQYPSTDAIIHTGDLAQVPVKQTYTRYLSYMQNLGIPFYQIPGNHDDIDLFPFYQHKNQVHAIHFGRWSVLLLNTAVDGRIDGRIKPEQLQQLDQLLAELQQQFVIVACHHHPFAMQSKWIDQHKLKNPENLTAVLARHSHVKAVIFGHVHQDSCHEWQHIRFFSTPSTCVQFKPFSENFALDDQAPGFRVLHLKANGELETQIQRVQTVRQQINSEISGY
ncbi:3',5'-cyclic-AMP phosphodiesterase [Acinetobacter sp. YH12201]|uniref:3',5'-cyclic-AMP phosphodiesterase n=1 Tax=Acinetobacter sp. YH12201 TaxID=2601140 RepID=UPI0015D32DFD|nr:3',5'-cyclic-AMP phosphodiesterase [Acinetobacter sp. YH12201]